MLINQHNNAGRILVTPRFFKGEIMDITFYQNVSDKRVINKTLNIAYVRTGCELIDETSIINPIFTVDMNAGLYQYNYVYIPYFNRYYFIDDITVIDGTRLMVKCTIDVLMSYASQILECEINSRRNEKSYDMYLPDDRTIESRYIRYSVKFPHSFKDETGSYVLITVGNGDVNLV